MTIIALCGNKRSGKDTAANYISSKHGYSHIKISTKLKETLKILFDFTDSQLETDKKEEIDIRYNTTPRKVMQFFGTEIMQYNIQEVIPSIGQNFFVKNVIDNLHKDKNYVISDLRFYNEYKELHKYDPNLIVIEIKRSETIPDSHISENEHIKIPKFFTIYNNSNLLDIETKIDKLLSII